MVLHLRRGLLPMELHSFSSGSRIVKEAVDLHRDTEICGMDGRNKLPLPPPSPRPTAPSVQPGEPQTRSCPFTLQRNYRGGRKLPRRSIDTAPELRLLLLGEIWGACPGPDRFDLANFGI